MKKKYQGFARANKQQHQALRLEFETLRMKSGESVTNYISRTMVIVNQMRIHGDKTNDVVVVEKILRSMTPNFNFVVCSIKEAHVVEELSIDELQSYLLIHERKICQQEKEEQVLKASTDNNFTHRRGRGRGNRGRGSGYNGRGHQNHHQGGGRSYQNYHQGGGRGYQNHHQRGVRGYQNHYHQGRGRGSHNSTNSVDKSNVECFRCHRYGHYQSECRVNLDNENGERTNVVENEEEVSLLMVCNAKEEKQKNLWYKLQQPYER